MMTNPFPGMNPYLEEHWRDVHTSLIIYLRDQLQEKLPEGLLARAEEQISVDEDGERVGYRPDIQVKEVPDWALRSPGETAPSGTTLAEPLVLVVLVEPETHRWVEIVEAGGRVITAIEILSPTNKSEAGERAYRRKQRTYLATGVNLVEIDLVRAGHHVLSIPLANIPERVRTLYMVCVARAIKPDAREIYALPLRQRLPAIRIPLRLADADVALDLQPLIDQCYERGRYAVTDYRREPLEPLPPEDARWMDELLRGRGLR